MPKRLIDFDALWVSRKIASLKPWARTEYLWCYGVADGGGSFEYDLEQIYWKVAPNRPDLDRKKLTKCFAEFERVGLLFAWFADSKRYGHWVGALKPGRLPSPSTRERYFMLKNIVVPMDGLKTFEARFQPTRDGHDVGHDLGHEVGHDSGRAVVEVGLRCGVGLGLGEGNGGGNGARRKPGRTVGDATVHEDPNPSIQVKTKNRKLLELRSTVSMLDTALRNQNIDSEQRTRIESERDSAQWKLRQLENDGGTNRGSLASD